MQVQQLDDGQLHLRTSFERVADEREHLDSFLANGRRLTVATSTTQFIHSKWK
jgi:hypothetical protein